jgi:hypothetical protein
MKKLAPLFAAAGLLAIAACNNTPAQNKAENIRDAAENTADQMEATGANIADSYQNKAEAVRNNAENRADAVEANAH